ncbi:uncharacterized protein LOC134278962 [Saccostrea cucullata]|uniref:uncharacterized protein LOC134278962 n=1 Tax=Saccostrea cuccullata TaxID=36930 RepID=UPI002ED485F5
MGGLVIFLFLLILVPEIIQTQTSSLVTVNKCPSNQTEWNKTAKIKNCKGKTPDYLCASIKNYPGKLGEICTQESLIKPETNYQEFFDAKMQIHNQKVLENVNDTEDAHNNLDMVVVFTLLTNFCNNIQPPGTGWGYKPTDNDDSLEADIERIRILWNLYCDDQVDAPNLQGVYGRMIGRFGELFNKEFTSSNNVDCNALESKIKSVRLRRNCDVEDGVVVTKNIKSALALLESSDIVICIGAIGCGKTTAMRYIQGKYEDKGRRTVWFEEYMNEEEVIDYKINNVFRERCKGHLKVLLEIHQHIYDAVLKLGKVQIMDIKNLIDYDHLDKTEMLLIWKELKKECHCVCDPSCWFKLIEFSSVLSNLSLSQGLVGNPFLMSMYCQHHEFFSNKDFTKSPVTALVNHFNSMKKENEELFHVLAFIMFVRVYKLNEDMMPWAGMISAELTEDSIKRCVEKYPEYLIEESDIVELKHELLTISLFKVLYETLVHHCDIGSILQLTRPKEECNSDFVNCLPPSHTEDIFEVKLLERVSKAKGCPFDRPHFLSRKWKNLKKNS